jgi:Flp pilus assembly protein TadG
MKPSFLHHFSRTTRGAVAMIFALSLVPLVLIAALAIDYSFFAEARSQVQLAADAAVTHAVRAAAGTYSLELSQSVAVATAKTDAIAAGETAGANWFAAQLGLLPTASVPSTSPNSSCTGKANPCVVVAALTSGAGFSGSVTYQGNYPPFFDRIFKSNATWYIAGASNAQAQYNYVEIMMLIDTSASMLIGATPADITTLETYDVCPPTNRVSTTAGDTELYIAAATRPGDLVDGDNKVNGRTYQYRAAPNSSPPSSPTSYGTTTAENADNFDFRTVVATGHMTYPTGDTDKGADDSTGNCYNGGTAATDYQQPGLADSVNNPGNAGVPCGFACHSTTTGETASGGSSYSADLYGFARYIGSLQTLKLRLDYVLAATEQVITAMINNEQTSNEFSIGVYQFNTALSNSTNVAVLASGAQGTPGDAIGDTTYEATYDLPDALKAVQGVDYQITPGETTLPAVVPLYNNQPDGNTNFTLAVTNFLAGKATNGNALAAVSTTTANSQSNPQKDIFIVTDGLEDECAHCTGSRVMGEMTSVASEAPAGGLNAATGSCAKFKKLGYTVYVLYIDYYPVPHYTYYVTNVVDPTATSPTDGFTNTDYGTMTDGSIQEMTTAANLNGLTAASGTYGKWSASNALSFADDSPTETALRACASVNPNGSATDPTYFYEATDAQDIGTQLNIMLETALGSAIRVTN